MLARLSAAVAAVVVDAMPLGVGEAVAHDVRIEEAVAMGDEESDAVPLNVGVTVDETLGVGVAVGETLGVGVTVDETLGVGVAVGETLGLALGLDASTSAMIMPSSTVTYKIDAEMVDEVTFSVRKLHRMAPLPPDVEIADIPTPVPMYNVPSDPIVGAHVLSAKGTNNFHSRSPVSLRSAYT